MPRDGTPGERADRVPDPPGRPTRSTSACGCTTPPPTASLAGESVRDYNLEQSDAVILILDTFRDQQNAFVFGTNPTGIEYDGQVANSGSGRRRLFGGGGNQRQQGGSGGGFNLNWDASWTSQRQRTQRGWYAEFRIPFSTLRYASGEDQVWGLNVVAPVRRLNEQSFWSPVPREFDQYRLNYAGTLEGLAPPTSGSSRSRRTRSSGPTGTTSAAMESFEHTTEVGGDAKVQITQGLTLDLTSTPTSRRSRSTRSRRTSRASTSRSPRSGRSSSRTRGASPSAAADRSSSSAAGSASRPTGPVPILGGGRLSGRAAGLNVGRSTSSPTSWRGSGPRTSTRSFGWPRSCRTARASAARSCGGPRTSTTTGTGRTRWTVRSGSAKRCRSAPSSPRPRRPG
jgi:hypothetical protein